MLPFIKGRLPGLWVTVGVVGAVLVLGLFVLPEPVVTWLWMDAVGYEVVFWTLLRTRVLLFVAGLVVALLYLGGNFFFLFRQVPVLQWLNADRPERARGPVQLGEVSLSPRQLRVVALVFTVVATLIFAVGLMSAWEAFLRYVGAQPYGEVDPLFGRDLAFYLLRLPFLQLVQGSLLGLTLVGMVMFLVAYVFIGNLRVEHGRLRAPRPVVWHLAANLALGLACWGWGYYLDRYELLYEGGGLVFGAGYTDVHVVLPALWGMLAATVVLIGLALYSAAANRYRALLVGLGLYAVASVVLLGVVPGVMQQAYVEPNELELETPYLRHNIAFTRVAFGIDDVVERDYPALPDLTLAQVMADQATLRNIRLWDPRLLLQTYRQLQEIRAYYAFHDVDVGRYRVDGMERQVMLAARELAPELPGRSDTWVNRHLQFTHGYGLAMNLVTPQGPEGTPDLLVKDLPPVTAPGLSVTQPAIYYGETTATYRIVNTEVPELDYARGDENVYTRYEGTGGVPIGSLGRRLLFSWALSDFNILLTDYITGDSRIQFWNRVTERVHRIAPFLRLDGDPYLVLEEGRLFWMLDAYTTSGTFPYAEPTAGGVNYIRNSVKVVVDAYDGAVSFYAADLRDPVLGAYRTAFPGMFQELSAMPPALRQHLRYPQDLFEVQREKYSRYHMQSPQVFYNNEDLWSQPMEQYGGEEVPMEPYYLLMRLPAEEQLSFLLMSPLTPQNRDNMIAWMAARYDPSGAGSLVVYKLPKERLVYGPNQVESMIDQDTEISEQLSLWDQRGSGVIRGNLIVVPLEGSFLYVEPVFLIAEGTQIPELQRVIVVHGDRLAMERTLEASLQAVFGGAMELQETAGPAGAPAGVPVPAADLAEARETLDRALRALREGDFATFGDELEALRRLLGSEEE